MAMIVYPIIPGANFARIFVIQIVRFFSLCVCILLIPILVISRGFLHPKRFEIIGFNCVHSYLFQLLLGYTLQRFPVSSLCGEHLSLMEIIIGILMWASTLLKILLQMKDF